MICARPVTVSGQPFRLTSLWVPPYLTPDAQVAELVDALVSGTSGESREGSSPFLGTNFLTAMCHHREVQPAG